MTLPADPRLLAARLERAQAAQLAGSGGAEELPLAGGRAVFKGVGSVSSAALGLGLDGPVSDGDLEALERFLGRGGGAVRVELTPFADPSLAAGLARRGYAVERLHQVWCRETAAPPAPVPAGALVRELRAGEEEAWVALFGEAWYGGDPGPEARRGIVAAARAAGGACFLAFRDGSAAGVALAFAWDGIALLHGAGVAARHRGHRLQGALIAGRLAWAAAQGCALAAAAAEPASASQRNLEASGFRCAYPKAVLIKTNGN